MCINTFRFRLPYNILFFQIPKSLHCPLITPSSFKVIRSVKFSTLKIIMCCNETHIYECKCRFACFEPCEAHKRNPQVDCQKTTGTQVFLHRRYKVLMIVGLTIDIGTIDGDCVVRLLKLERVKVAFIIYCCVSDSVLESKCYSNYSRY